MSPIRPAGAQPTASLSPSCVTTPPTCKTRGSRAVIARRRKLELLMAASLDAERPEIVGNTYVVVGTLDRTDWREGRQEQAAPSEVFERTYVFEDVLHFEITGGWQLPPEE
jgi:hypothetical protein